jgi:hypothetical protein
MVIASAASERFKREPESEETLFRKRFPNVYLGKQITSTKKMAKRYFIK